jgi:hypothetical protein
MNTVNPDFQSLAAHVQRLELAHRKSKWIVMAALLAAMAGVIAGCAGRSGTVEGDRIILRDKEGRMRMEIAMSYETGPNGYPSIALLDENGKKRTSIGAGVLNIVGDKGTSVVLLDGQLQFNTDSGVTARLDGELGRESLWLFGHDEDSAGNILIDADTPVIEVSDTKGFRADLGRNRFVASRTGNTQTTSAAALVFANKDGKVLWSAP